MFVSHLYVFFGETSTYFFGPFFDWATYFSGIELHVLLVFLRLIPCQLLCLLLFSLILNMSFHLAYSFLRCAKAFKFNYVPFGFLFVCLFVFCFYFHYSGRWVIEDPDVIYVRECSPLPLLSSRSFIVSGITFRSLIHIEFIFVFGVR